MPMPEKKGECASPYFRVTLFQPEIPNNTGSISRLCVGAHAELCLVGKLGFSLDDKRLRRAGLDHWPNLKLSRVESLEPLLKQPNLAIFSKRGKKPYWQHSFNKGDRLLFGSETRGLPLNILEEYSDKTFALPMPGPVRSINLANSVAIVVYEGLRQLAAKGEKMALARETGPESFDMGSC